MLSEFDEFSIIFLLIFHCIILHNLSLESTGIWNLTMINEFQHLIVNVSIFGSNSMLSTRTTFDSNTNVIDFKNFAITKQNKNNPKIFTIHSTKTSLFSFQQRSNRICEIFFF